MFIENIKQLPEWKLQWLLTSYSYSFQGMKVKIRHWNGVASWTWVANDENCGICRMPFNGCCPDCE